MRRARSVPTFLLVLVGVLSLDQTARAADPDPDPWWGRDKALHFGASAVIASGGYAVGTLAFDKRLDAALFGGSVALAVGAAKEGADALGMGHPSWKDFTWDAIGTLVGLAVAWSIDVLIVRPTPAPAH